MESNVKETLYKLLIEQFKVECDDRADLIDPDCELCWKSLTVGWAIAKGLEPDDAHDFTLHIRYHTDLG